VVLDRDAFARQVAEEVRTRALDPDWVAGDDRA
jgi:hypothetical protein